MTDHAAIVREALKHRQRGTGSTRNTEPALAALSALEQELGDAQENALMEMRLAEEWRKERLAAEQELAEAKRERDMVGKAQRHADARVIELAAELVELQQIQRDWFGLQERAKAAEAALFAVREALECSLPLLHTALSRIRNV